MAAIRRSLIPPSQSSAFTPAANGSAATGISRYAARTDHVHAASTIAVKAASATLAVSEIGRTVSNEGATAKAVYTLPTAAAGYRYRFAVQDADGVRVTAASGDTIRNGSAVSAAAGYIENTTVGSFVEIESLNATEWFVTCAIGTWTPV